MGLEFVCVFGHDAFEYEGGGGWWMDSEEIYPLPKTPLYSVLRWILDQLNTSSFDFIAEEGDDSPVHTIVLGQGASRYASAEELQEQVALLHRSG